VSNTDPSGEVIETLDPRITLYPSMRLVPSGAVGRSQTPSHATWLADHRLARRSEHTRS